MKIPAIAALLLLLFCVTPASAQSPWPKITSVDWHPSLPVIAFSLYKDRCDGYETVYIMTPRYPSLLGTLGLFGCPIDGVQWNSTGTELLGSTSFDDASIWNVAEPTSHRVWGPNYTMSGRAQDLWSPDDQRVANISYTMGTINLWDAQTGHAVASIEVYSLNHLLDWTTDSQGIIYGGLSVALLDVRTQQTVRTFRGNTMSISAVAWNDYATPTIAAGGIDGNIYIYNSGSSTPLRLWQGHSDKILRMVWNPDGRTLATTGDDGLLKIWDTQTGELLESYNEGRVMGLDWSPDGAQLAYGGSSNNGALTIIQPKLALMIATPETGK